MVSSEKTREYYRGLADATRWDAGEIVEDGVVVGEIRIDDVSEDYIEGLREGGLLK